MINDDLALYESLKSLDYRTALVQLYTTKAREDIETFVQFALNINGLHLSLFRVEAYEALGAWCVAVQLRPFTDTDRIMAADFYLHREPEACSIYTQEHTLEPMRFGTAMKQAVLDCFACGRAQIADVNAIHDAAAVLEFAKTSKRKDFASTAKQCIEDLH